MSVRVRFAPSPTGQVHIGNIRAAIFNWLFARHEKGEFLLRVEDTDLERSTPEAITALLDVMQWLGLDYDEPPLYQTSQRTQHLAAAEKLLASGAAYRFAKGGGPEAILFRIPWQADDVPGVTTVGAAEYEVHPEVPVTVDATGIAFAQTSRKGKAIPQNSCLAGMPDLEIFDAGGNCLFKLAEEIDGVLAGDAEFAIEQPARITFTRRQIQFTDLIKGSLAKPLDSLRDFVIVRGDGSPVFHLANVCDDATQAVTHIIRGDDHVENTYRHLFLFQALSLNPPQYAHLPMIVNDQGKPYSKRDGDAFVGEFRDKGYLAEALFNYLTLLGWSPGDDREKLSRSELVALFSLDRVQSSAAQMDLRKLQNLNGQYLAELPPTEFLELARTHLDAHDWGTEVADEELAEVAALMQTRTKLLTDVSSWKYFFVDSPEYDEKACRKFLSKPEVVTALAELETVLDETPFLPEAIEQAIHHATDAAGIPQGKLNQPLRVAVTGTTVGAGVYETIALIGRERVIRRLQHCRETYCS
jgi:glutamyl-tRNA synthetase